MGSEGNKGLRFWEKAKKFQEEKPNAKEEESRREESREEALAEASAGPTMKSTASHSRRPFLFCAPPRLAEVSQRFSLQCY
jgi:hypothetical protein